MTMMVEEIVKSTPTNDENHSKQLEEIDQLFYTTMNSNEYQIVPSNSNHIPQLDSKKLLERGSGILSFQNSDGIN